MSHLPVLLLGGHLGCSQILSAKNNIVMDINQCSCLLIHMTHLWAFILRIIVVHNTIHNDLGEHK